MQQIKKKLYVAPRVKSVKFQVENGYTLSVENETYVWHNRRGVDFWGTANGTTGTTDYESSSLSFGRDGENESHF